jgi:hypothetical protein
MTKTLAIVFGIVFIIIGILGVLPMTAPRDDQGMRMLLGIFHVNKWHNAVHLVTGVVAVLCGLAGPGAARSWFRIFGIIYAIVAIWGLVIGQGYILGLIANNPADTYLHIGLAVVFLFIGFGTARQTA